MVSRFTWRRAIGLSVLCLLLAACGAPHTPTPALTLMASPPRQIVPQPSGTPVPKAAQIVIAAVDKKAEYVDIKNLDSVARDLAGCVLVSKRGNQVCSLVGTLGPGETLRIHALAMDAGKGGYNCGFGTPVWDDDLSDPAVLYDAQGREIDRK